MWAEVPEETVWTHPARIFVDQPIDPFFTRHDLFARLHKGLACCPLVSSLFNRLQGKNTSCSLAGRFRVDAAQGVCVTPSHPDKYSNSANSPTMELVFDLSCLDPCKAEQDRKELGNNRREIPTQIRC
jgi:hypothetical protein